MRCALKYTKTAVVLFFVLLTLLGLWTAGDYTGSYDELWEQVQFVHEEECTTTTFFDVYNQHFEN